MENKTTRNAEQKKVQIHQMIIKRINIERKKV